MTCRTTFFAADAAAGCARATNRTAAYWRLITSEHDTAPIARSNPLSHCASVQLDEHRRLGRQHPGHPGHLWDFHKR